MIKYELIPHTADIRLKANGTTQEELFLAALQGMATIIAHSPTLNPLPSDSEKASVSREIKIESPDTTSLLIDFLSEVLTACHTKKSVFRDAEFLKLDKNKLHAIIKGVRVTAFDQDIKAVTYHEANVRKNINGSWESIIVFDI